MTTTINGRRDRSARPRKNMGAADLVQWHGLAIPRRLAQSISAQCVRAPGLEREIISRLGRLVDDPWGLRHDADGVTTILHSEPSAYHGTIYVVVDNACRSMRFGRPDAYDQGAVHGSTSHRYVSAMAGHITAPCRVLMVGLGCGGLLRLLAGCEVDIVEIDPAVVRVARRFFDVDNTHRIETADVALWARSRAQHRGRCYDAIVLDAYDATSYPRALMSRQFFRTLKHRLAPGGVVVVNLALISARDHDHVIRRMRDTIGRVSVSRVAGMRNEIVSCRTAPEDLCRLR